MNPKPRKRLLANIPRPTRKTVQILAIGVAIVAGLYFMMLRGARSDLADVQQRLGQQNSALLSLQADLDLYRSGDVLSGDALAEAVGPVEALLPNASSNPGSAFTLIQTLATQAGLQPSSVSLAASYQLINDSKTSGGKADTASADRISKLGVESDNLAVSVGAIRVAGDVEQMLEWLEQLDQFDQLVTYQTTGIATTATGYVMSVDLYLWTTTEAEWRNGKPMPSTPAVPAATPEG
jgi:hypothetical protein